MISRAAGTVIAAGAVLFIGYCVYFDRKRRADPMYKEKIRKRRSAEKKRQEAKNNVQLPDLRDYEAVQKFFIEEVQLGEDLLGQGDIDNGVEHLSMAVAVCGQPQQLLQVLQQTLPPQVFHLLLQRLPVVSQRISSSMSTPAGDSRAPGPGPIVEMAEDDVE